MDDEDEFTPKDLEILPNKIVHDIMQYGITHDSSQQDDSNNYTESSVSINMKKYNPKNRKFKKEALCSMNRVASLFVLYITTIAESIAKMNKRSTVFDKDIIQALRQCMFWEVESQIADELEKLEKEDSKLNDFEESKIDDNNLDDDNDLEYGDDDQDVEENVNEDNDNEMELDEVNLDLDNLDNNSKDNSNDNNYNPNNVMDNSYNKDTDNQNNNQDNYENEDNKDDKHLE